MGAECTDTEVSMLVKKGNSPRGQKSARGQVTSERKSIETDETGDNEKIPHCYHYSAGVNCMAGGGFSRLHRQAVEQAGVHSCLSTPTLDVLSVLT